MDRHVSLLRRMLHEYQAQPWKIEIDGEDTSGRFLLWEAMNIRSIGPALYLAPQAATHDGRLDFVSVRETDRDLLMDHLEARLSKKKHKFPLPIRRFRQLRIVWEGATLRMDDEIWPRKKRKQKRPRKIEITMKPSGLVVLQVAHG